MFKPTQIICVFVLLAVASAGYDSAAALEYAWASSLAYCDPNAINAWTCGTNCQHLPGYQPYFTEVFNVAPGETLSFSMIFNPSTKRFIVSFRGTAGTEQLLLEILKGDAVTYGLENIPNALADDYFYGHYVSTIRPVFQPLMRNAYNEYGGYQFIFTGHSLGGALATLAAFDAISSGLVPGSDVIMYNYGSPRVANQVLAQAMESSMAEVYRVVHYQDLVPHVPPCDGVPCSPTAFYDPNSLLWPAWHVQPQIFYNEDFSSYQSCSAEDPKCQDQFTLSQTNINDHGTYMGISMGCSGTSAIGFGPNQENVKIRPSFVNLLTK